MAAVVTTNPVNPSSYYFTNITFQVEGTLFRVPRHHFERESPVFRDMFQMPVATGTVPDGSSDDNPLRLDGVCKEDFLQLLRVMFPSRLLALETFSVCQWVSVLRLSAMWEMDLLTSIVLENLLESSGSREEWGSLLELSAERQLPAARALAIHKLSFRLQVGVDMVLMARKYQVKHWMQAGLNQLITRDRFFSDAEGETLGWKTTLKLCRVREQYIKRSLGYGFDLTLEVNKEFADELEGMTE